LGEFLKYKSSERFGRLFKKKTKICLKLDYINVSWVTFWAIFWNPLGDFFSDKFGHPGSGVALGTPSSSLLPVARHGFDFRLFFST
jgi:hypothetical protein